MRIVINSGGLGGISIFSMTQHIDELINQASSMTSGLNILKQGIYNMNGGVGCLQNALDNIGFRITQAETHNSNLSQVKQKTEAFITFTRNVDKSVSGMVSSNNEEFYKVNSWANPSISINPGGGLLDLFDEWISRGKQWIDDRDSSMIPFGTAGLAAAAGFLNSAGGGAGGGGGGGWSSDAEESSGVTITGSGPSGKVEDGKASGSLLSGSIEGNGAFVGFDTSGKLEGELVGGSAKASAGGEWDLKKKNASVSAEAKAEGHLAKGSASGSIGLLNGKVEGSVGNVGAKGEVGLSIFDSGKFSPSIYAGASAEASVAKGSAETSFGTEEYNAFVEAKGSVLSAKAHAEAGAGKITYTDSAGRTQTSYGAKAEAGAEAYLAEGTVSGGVTICGIKFDIGVSGKAGGAGAKAGAHATTDNIGAEAHVGLGVGVGVKFNVDFSGFENPLDDIGDTLEDIGDSIGSTIEDIGDSDWMPWNWF